jgi:hypothetical protein
LIVKLRERPQRDGQAARVQQRVRLCALHAWGKMGIRGIRLGDGMLNAVDSVHCLH